MVLGLERIKQSFEIGLVFAGEDQGAGVEPVFQAVPADGSASSGRLRAGTFLCVSPVSLYLSCSCHMVTLESPALTLGLWFGNREKILSLNFRVADGS